jgi:hypothetical protein
LTFATSRAIITHKDGYLLQQEVGQSMSGEIAASCCGQGAVISLSGFPEKQP